MTPSAAIPSKRFAALETTWGRLLIPSLSDIFILALIVCLFGQDGWKPLMQDGDTGWHIRTGEYILEHGAVPHHDIFSWSKPEAPWFAWEWLTDVQYAVLHARWGLGGIAVVSGILIAASAYVLLRTMLWSTANVFVALALTLMYAGASALHYHARPHVWTLVLFAVSVGILTRDRKQQDKLVWLLVPLTCLWTNLHGGFLALIACAALAALGTALEDFGSWRKPLRYAGLTCACLAASMINPYGIQLHLHVAEYMQSDFIRNFVQEFKSPVFRTESARYFEAVLMLGVGSVALLIGRRRYVEALWILFFAHSALGSARHIPIFVLVAAPSISVEVTRWWNRLVRDRSSKSLFGVLHSFANDAAPSFRRATPWLVLGLVPVILYTSARGWPVDFEETFPTEMVAVQRHRLHGQRLFTTDQWGDYILYKLWPAQRVFVDGRSDFYGAELGKEYLSMMNASHQWNRIVDRHGITMMLLPVKWPLASVLKMSAGWRVLADDGKAILFEQRR